MWTWIRHLLESRFCGALTPMESGTTRGKVDPMLISLEAPYWPLVASNDVETIVYRKASSVPLIWFLRRKGLEAPYWPLDYGHANERRLNHYMLANARTLDSFSPVDVTHSSTECGIFVARHFPWAPIIHIYVTWMSSGIMINRTSHGSQRMSGNVCIIWSSAS